ncbi:MULTISPECIES: regulatory protein RecX [Thalassospira]|uniref:Regulatory protein RecX n=1 Tax=Thalassospira profundimaris TaxID=502049 RepID=A0A367VFK6_9PROT|nr:MULTISPECIES: RecX family transcriptional regulator [Thalassospira]KZB73601.1 RecX family transcriptional regulator [Thalassospira sp. MCCC 1A01148]RCK23955.1 RecX family transcriptional regulator [Thalassospira profundimaris]
MRDKHRQSPETSDSEPEKKPAGNARFSSRSDKKSKTRSYEPKRPRKVTRDYLMNYATWYLERFAASRARLETLMRGKIRLSVAEHGTDPDEAVAWMNSVLSACEKAGFINDDAYAKGRARSLLRRGKALRVIAADLSSRGIASDQVDAALAELKAEADDAAYEEVRGTDPNIAAAAAYARRRRLGPWRRPDIREEKRDKDMAALARQGFGYDTATRIINSEIEELEDLLSMIDGI